MTYEFKEYQPTQLLTKHLNMGGSNPSGDTIDVTSKYFTRNGKPWIGVMGEFHFTRCDKDQWRIELAKMKAGGIGIVSTYMFWIHHEEIEGEFNFTGNNDLRTFVEYCQELGLEVILRLGPWAHGECRNGGFPDWLLKKPFPLRENNEGYLALTRIWYTKIFEQVKGLLYRDGGNIIGIQLENELVWNADHLATLKTIAIECGFDVPLYTVTGWNGECGAEIPVDEVVPVFGGYCEAPWENHQNKMEPSVHSFFNRMRNDSAIGEDLIPVTISSGWQLPYERYPFATCELGGGMQVTHHRRPRVLPNDIYSIALVKTGSGNNLMGYYMYHGGTNPIGALSTMQESKETGYPNDYSILSYDFQAPLSEYGETRRQYGLLNTLHLFAEDFGDVLAPMDAVDSKTTLHRHDTTSLRYGLRTNGESGFVFINHYQRLTTLEDVKDVVIRVGDVEFPSIDVCGDVSFFMPYNMDLSGNLLRYATAQPLCKVNDTYFFAAIDGIAPTFQFENEEPITIQAGLESKYTYKNMNIVVLTWEQASYARRLSGVLYIGDGCDVYELDGEILSVQDGSFEYAVWDGNAFNTVSVKRDFVEASIEFEPVEEPFTPTYVDELNIEDDRARTWYKLSVSNDSGFVEIPHQYDVAQIYADGKMVADNYYYGAPWRVPAKLLYGKTCYLVFSELKDDFYREF